MLQETIQLAVPFESLVDALAGLELEAKQRLWELLEAQLSQTEQKCGEQAPEGQAESREARSAYLAVTKVTQKRVRAVYRSGTFVLQEPCDVPEGSEVALVVQIPRVLVPELTDPLERERLLEVIAERMRQNPLPTEAPRFTREDLHERR